jgi:hypothetical protein
VADYVGARAVCVLKQDTVALTIGGEQYSLNSDLAYVLSVYPLSYDRQSLKYIPLPGFGLIPTGGSKTINNFIPLNEIQKLIVDPKPEATDNVLVFYNANPYVLSGDTANTNLPTKYSEAVIWYTTGLAQVRLGNYQEATYYFTLFQWEMEKNIITFSSPPYDVVINPKIVNR